MFVGIFLNIIHEHACTHAPGNYLWGAGSHSLVGHDDLGPGRRHPWRFLAAGRPAPGHPPHPPAPPSRMSAWGGTEALGLCGSVCVLHIKSYVSTFTSAQSVRLHSPPSPSALGRAHALLRKLEGAHRPGVAVATTVAAATAALAIARTTVLSTEVERRTLHRLVGAEFKT